MVKAKKKPVRKTFLVRVPVGLRAVLDRIEARTGASYGAVVAMAVMEFAVKHGTETGGKR